MNNLILEINLNYPGHFSYIPIKSKLIKKELIDSFLIKLEYSIDKKIKIFPFCGYNFKTSYHTTPDGRIIEWSIPIYDIDEWFDRFGNKV